MTDCIRRWPLWGVLLTGVANALLWEQGWRIVTDPLWLLVTLGANAVLAGIATPERPGYTAAALALGTPFPFGHTVIAIGLVPVYSAASFVDEGASTALLLLVCLAAAYAPCWLLVRIGYATTRAIVLFPMSRRAALLLVLLLLPVLNGFAAAQERTGTVQVRVSTDRADWRYQPGQPVRFRITAIQDGHPLTGIKVSYRIGPEMMPPRTDQSAALTADGLTVDGGTLNEPGFLRCIAVVEKNGKTYRGLATAAFTPEAIKPTQQDPADFDQFWAAGKAALAKLPVDARLTPLPGYGNAAVDCFQVNLQNVGATISGAPSRFYGVLCEPKAPGKYPALLSVPGAGVRPYRGLVEMASRGIITLQVGIHGIPVTMDQSVYDSLGVGALGGYNAFGLDNRDRYYYRRVYLGCVRANDFLTGHPKYDGANLAVTGGSQGGALSIVTAALDPRVRGLAAYYPALSDVTGYLSNRAGGWPHMFRAADGPLSHRSQDKIETSRYYDVVNFARRVKVPGLYSWGFNDETCPPTSMYSAYNVIPGQKKLLLALETGHNNIPEQVAEVDAWLEAFLKRGSSAN